MTLANGLIASSPVLATEGYVDLLRSGPHWLFELTLELVSAPVVFLVGRAWRSGLLRHLHHDLDALRDDLQPPTAPGADAERAAPASDVGHRSVSQLIAGGPSAAQPGPARGRVPLSWFSAPFGVSGLAGAWSYAAHAHLAPQIVGTLLGVLSGTVWIVLMVLYLRQVGGLRGLAHDLADPTGGPFAALVLLTPTLLVVQVGHQAPNVARVAFDVVVVLMIGLAGWLIGLWISRPLELDRLHPGYFLPSLAGGYVASAGASALGQPHLAAVMFGLASLSWMVLGALVLARLMFRPPLPDALVPTMAIQIAPPALATLAWLSMNGGRPDAIVSGLAGYGLLMIAAQGPLLSTYRRLSFGLGFWAFTFPVTAVATATLHWLTMTQPAGSAAWRWLVLGAATLLVTLIGARTGVAIGRGELRAPVQARVRESHAASEDVASAPGSGTGWAA